jgi:YbbR domain-containing protein
LRLTLRGITTHWKLKLASLALAVLLWVVVSAEQETTQWIPVRVEPVLRDPDFVLTGGVHPATVRVRFSGSGRELWEVAIRRPTLVLPVRSGTAGSYEVDPQMVEIPANLHVHAEDVRPGVVRLDLQRLAEKVVPVRAALARRSAAAYVIANDVHVTPSTVRLTGPGQALEQIDTVFTAPIDILPGDTAGFVRRVGLDTAAFDGISLSVGSVRVSGTVDRRVDRGFAVVPVDVPAGLVATPGQVDVHVVGARGVADLGPSSIRAVVRGDLTPASIPPAGIDVPVTVEGLPDGATARIVPARVHLTAARQTVSIDTPRLPLPAPLHPAAPPPSAPAPAPGPARPPAPSHPGPQPSAAAPAPAPAHPGAPPPAAPAAPAAPARPR